MWYCVEGLFGEVALLEVGVHIETLGTEVEGARHIGYHTLTAFPHLRRPHPHVPVPLLQKEEKKVDNCYIALNAQLVML